MQGPATQTTLVEFFTLEGCSSCPSAEEWFASFGRFPDLWVRFVPVAFHVTYWDSLGWRDPFATSEFTGRQYAYAQRWGAGSVYALN